MSFRLVYEKRFVDDLQKIETKAKLRIKNKLEWLAESVHNSRHTLLKGEEFKDVFKLRIGNWRVFYKIDFKDEIIYIITIIDRKEAYKKRK